VPTLDEFKQHINIGDRGNDGELSKHLDAAVGTVEGIVGPLSVQSFTETHYGLFSPYVVLRKPRVVAVTDVQMLAPTWLAAFPYLAADYQLDSELGVLRLLNGRRFQGDVTVTYTAGFTSEPAAVRLATLIVAAHLWETKRGAAPLPMAGGGDVTTPGLGYAIPNRARDLLVDYAVSVTVA
jgi:hypothetical protein